MLTQVSFYDLIADEGLRVGASHDAGIADAFFGLEELTVIVYHELFAVGADEEVRILLRHLMKLYRVLLQYFVLLQFG